MVAVLPSKSERFVNDFGRPEIPAVARIALVPAPPESGRVPLQPDRRLLERALDTAGDVRSYHEWGAAYRGALRGARHEVYVIGPVGPRAETIETLRIFCALVTPSLVIALVDGADAYTIRSLFRSGVADVIEWPAEALAVKLSLIHI